MTIQSLAWDLFNHILGFSLHHERTEYFNQYIKETYYTPIRSPPNKFSVTLADILDAGLEVEPTGHLDHHLKIAGSKVYILSTRYNTEIFYGYSNNKVAA